MGPDKTTTGPSIVPLIVKGPPATRSGPFHSLLEAISTDPARTTPRSTAETGTAIPQSRTPAKRTNKNQGCLAAGVAPSSWMAVVFDLCLVMKALDRRWQAVDTKDP